VVITTAQIFGRKAPLIVTKEMVAAMKNGSVIIDLAAGSGGNVEGTVLGEEVAVNGVTIIGLENMPSRVAAHTSQMYSSNLTNFISEYWDGETKNFKIRLDDEIIEGCLVTHENEIFSKTLKNLCKGKNMDPITSKNIYLISMSMVLMLAVFVGFEVISKVPAKLHTPLMSRSNAISGVTIVGAIMASGSADNNISILLGTAAVIFATINVVGGYVVTDRMLGMFRKKTDGGRK